MAAERSRLRATARRGLVRLANLAAGSGHHEWHSAERVYLDLEQPTAARNEPRWGHGKPPLESLVRLLEPRHADFKQFVSHVDTYSDDLSAISRVPEHRDGPTWSNEYFSGIDAASLYCALRERRPARYVEVGSGNSTKFAARAKADGGLDTEIVSIDPEPRTDIDAICDRVIRARLEDADLEVYETLGAGDVVLFDGSHRIFMNNDVATFFLEVLPHLHPEVLVGVHDIALPDDYHPGNARFYWTEQYMLAMALLAAGPDRIRPVLPCHYVCVQPELKAHLDETWDRAGLKGINGYGSTFWFQAAF